MRFRHKSPAAVRLASLWHPPSCRNTKAWSAHEPRGTPKLAKWIRSTTQWSGHAKVRTSRAGCSSHRQVTLFAWQWCDSTERWGGRGGGGGVAAAAAEGEEGKEKEERAAAVRRRSRHIVR